VLVLERIWFFSSPLFVVKALSPARHPHVRSRFYLLFCWRIRHSKLSADYANIQNLWVNFELQQVTLPTVLQEIKIVTWKAVVVNVKIQFVKLIETFSKFLNRSGQKSCDDTKLLTVEGSHIELRLTDPCFLQLRFLVHNKTVNVTLIASPPWYSYNVQSDLRICWSKVPNYTLSPVNRYQTTVHRNSTVKLYTFRNH